ncbi:MAG TPA: sensor histidine kinase, partial [Saprospiraceae bacterium]|nr:sensor histidine kinase [Saprospiraceae bacterium]
MIQEKKLNTLLQRENQLKQLTINQGRRIRFLLGGGMTVLALLGIVIFGQFRKQQRKNAIIRRQSEELTVLHKEVHHRVKNNLQVISSMLDLQSLSLQDNAAKEVIKESILRVQAMAFIHQNLYLDDASNTVNMQEYFQTLADHLFNAYPVHSSSIQYSLHIGALRLHTDTAVPLGMIVNELVGNALKYAFPNRQRGHIHIALEMK